jgi:hypothetical protein
MVHDVRDLDFKPKNLEIRCIRMSSQALTLQTRHGSQAPECQSSNSVHAGSVTCATRFAILDPWSSGNVAFHSLLCLLLTLA